MKKVFFSAIALVPFAISSVFFAKPISNLILLAAIAGSGTNIFIASTSTPHEKVQQ